MKLSCRSLYVSGMIVSLSIMIWCTTTAQGQGKPPAHDESRWFGSVRQLTSVELGLARSGEAYFSPDVKRITFLAYPVGKEDYQTFVMNLDGTGLKMVSKGIGGTACPYFHPSGKKMIFAANHHDLRPETTGERKRPRHGESSAAAGDQHPGGHPGGHPGQEPQGHPSGAPRDTSEGPQDGGRRYVWKYYPGMEIFEYTFATSGLKRLTHSEGYDAECAYSPDGQHIVFSSLRDGDQEVYICDADGGNPRRITHAKGGDGGPFFGPDGKRICYRSDRAGTGNLQVFVNNFAGTAEQALTGNETFNWCPFWHPSGKWLIFTHADFGQPGRPNFDLFLLRDDGSEMHQVTSDPAFDGLPVFSPDGRYLMWTSTRNGVYPPQIFVAEFKGLTPDGELRVATE